MHSYATEKWLTRFLNLLVCLIIHIIRFKLISRNLQQLFFDFFPFL